MKKIMSLLLAAVMLLSFAACSGNGGGQTAEATQEPTEAPTAEPTEEPRMSMEEMLEVAVEATVDNIFYATVYDNIAKAEYSYCDKALLIEGYIMKINADCFSLGNDEGQAFLNIDIYLPKEELMNLENNQYIRIVGETDDSIIQGTETINGTVFPSYHLAVHNAYVVSEYKEVTGIVRKFVDGFALETGSNLNTHLDLSLGTVDSSELEKLIGQTVTIKCKVIRVHNYSGYGYLHRAAEIVN